jgi:hypothetical protein
MFQERACGVLEHYVLAETYRELKCSGEAIARCTRCILMAVNITDAEERGAGCRQHIIKNLYQFTDCGSVMYKDY